MLVRLQLITSMTHSKMKEADRDTGISKDKFFIVKVNKINNKKRLSSVKNKSLKLQEPSKI